MVNESKLCVNSTTAFTAYIIMFANELFTVDNHALVQVYFLQRAFENKFF